jgi:hypothetical protein
MDLSFSIDPPLGAKLHVNMDASAAFSKVHNDHNVYILGAGFAVEAGYPVIKEFMNRMRDAAAWLQVQGKRSDELAAIELVLDFRLKAAAASYRIPINVDNVEELFSLAAASGDKSLAAAMPLAISATLDYSRAIWRQNKNFAVGVVSDRNWNLPETWPHVPGSMIAAYAEQKPTRDWRVCPPHDLYLGLMCGYFNRAHDDSRNTLITLNYDLLIEDALNRLGIGFSYGVKGNRISRPTKDSFLHTELSDAPLKLLTLHGSINWYSPMIPSMIKDIVSEKQPYHVSRVVLERLASGISAFDSYSDLIEFPDKQPPFIVPPTWSKSLEGPLDTVLNAAVEALRTATRIIIIGYSIPTTDLHFRYLLAAGLRENISLRKIYFVNPALDQEQEEVEARLFGRFGLFRQEHRSQQTVQLVSRTLRDFLTGHFNNDYEYYTNQIARPLNPPAQQFDPNMPWILHANMSGLPST